MKESSITQWLEIEVIVLGLNWLGTVCLGGLNFLGSNWLGTKFVGDLLSRRTKLLGTECEGPNVRGPNASQPNVPMYFQEVPSYLRLLMYP